MDGSIQARMIDDGSDRARRDIETLSADCVYSVSAFSTRELGQAKMRIRNWQAAISAFHRCRGSDLTSLAEEVESVVRRCGKVTLGEVIRALNQVHPAVVIGAAVLALRARSIGSDMDANPWSVHTRTLPADLANYHEWPPCETSLLDSADLALFEQRRKALVAYLGGLRTAEIASQFGIERTEVLRYLNRCVAVLGDGRIAGWAGLIKGFRTRAPTRFKPHCLIRSPMCSSPWTNTSPLASLQAGRSEGVSATRRHIRSFLSSVVAPAWARMNGRSVSAGMAERQSGYT
ncbi:hypothetical protein G6F40_012781 [Rhizopus arrhizus]|nr:hypothetical protein G6F40_012781 [Rhizopus arrhizus]